MDTVIRYCWLFWILIYFDIADTSADVICEKNKQIQDVWNESSLFCFQRNLTPISRNENFNKLNFMQ